MSDHLFVYGSLLSKAGHPNGERLASEARLVGCATTSGRLYAISWYPGLVESRECRDRVHGEVWHLKAPADSLIWLDAYEGIRPGAQDTDDYARILQDCQLADGHSVRAWVYAYRKTVDESLRVPSGRWMEMLNARGTSRMMQDE